jgi:ubiquinone/menaquinone biosynthesis C-methylase UbiE
MSLLGRHKRTWDKLGEMDPLWFILSEPEGKFGKWDVEEFFTSGQGEMAVVLAKAEELGYPKQRETALDFGCGVGRLTRGMAKYFKHSHGIDISKSMIAKAKELNLAFPNCQFSVNFADHLGMFPDNQFDFIYSNIVLQHLPTRTMIKSYVAEFCRVLRPDGLLVFQLPAQIYFRHRLQLRRRLYAFLHGLGFHDEYLYTKLGLGPVKMKFVSKDEIVGLLESAGAKVIKIEETRCPELISNLYFATK